MRLNKPNIANNLSLLTGSRIFLALDGAGAFHAVPVRRADWEKTAISSPFSQYQFIKMPFGLANAPATYSRIVAKTLQHLPSSEVLCYLYDRAIHSEDAWGHLQILRKVLATFHAAGLQISAEKAQLFLGSHQVPGTRGQRPRDHHPSGVHLCHQRLANSEHSQDSVSLPGEVRVLPTLHCGLRHGLRPVSTIYPPGPA